MAPAEPNVTDLVAGLIDQHGGAIVKAGLTGELPQDVLDAAQDLTGALRDAIAAGSQIESDFADLNRRRDLIPRDGYDRLIRDAQRDAAEKVKTAQSAAERSYKQLQASLEEAALPQFKPEREQLARDEAALALSAGNPELAATHLALYGNREAVAAMLSPWGKTLLLARGVRDPDRVLKEARKLAVVRAKDEGDSPAAIALRDHLSGLGAAKGSAGSKARDLAGRWALR